MLESLKDRIGDLADSDAVQGIKDSVGDLASTVKDGVGDLGNAVKGSVGDLTNSVDLKALMPFLVSGGAGALAGGLMAGRRKADNGESRSAHVARILRNALLTGGLAAGGHYLVGKGLKSTLGQSVTEPESGAAPSQGPLETAVKNIAFSPLTALGAGASALYATHDTKHIGAAGDKAKAFLSRFARENPDAPTTSHLRHTATAAEIGDLERKAGPSYNPRTRQLAGLPSDVMTKDHEFLKRIPQGILDRIPGIQNASGQGDVQKLKGLLSTALRKGPLSTFGQSHPRRAMRGALGLTAAGIPAVLGAFLTSPDSN